MVNSIYVQVTVMKEQPNPWWQGLLNKPIMSLLDVHSMKEHSIISVAGILGFLSVEDKIVKCDTRKLLIMKLIDRTATIEVRSWSATLEEFSRFRDRPIMLKRVRVTAYAGIKMLELIDGGGTQVVDTFDESSDLASFWKEPA